MIADNEAVHVTKSTFKEVLARDGVLVYRTRGVSMEPMLRLGRDLVTIRAAKPGERFHENDVVLYYQAVGRYVLHRIVGWALRATLSLATIASPMNAMSRSKTCSASWSRSCAMARCARSTIPITLLM